MKKTFSSLVNDSNFSDVTLVCSDAKQIKAHKVILGGSSPFFRAILLNNPHQHPLIYLKGLQSEDLKAVLQFIYLGQTRILKDQVDSFLEAARELQVEGLAEQQKKVHMVPELSGFHGEYNEEPKPNEPHEQFLSLPNSNDDLNTVADYSCDSWGLTSFSKPDIVGPFTLKEHGKGVHREMDSALETFPDEERLPNAEFMHVNDIEEEPLKETIEPTLYDMTEVELESDFDEPLDMEDNIYKDISMSTNIENSCNICGFVTMAKKKGVNFILRRHKERNHPENQDQMETLTTYIPRVKPLEDVVETDNHEKEESKPFDMDIDDSVSTNNVTSCNICGFVTAAKRYSDIKAVMKRHKLKAHSEEQEHVDEIKVIPHSQSVNHELSHVQQTV